MDLNEFRVILQRSKVSVWALIETAITVASLDYGEELKDRRDKIVEKLYFPSSAQICKNCHNDVVDNNHQHRLQQLPEQQLDHRNSKSPLTPESNHRINDDNGNEDEDLDPFGGLFDDEPTRILQIRERLEDPELSEETVVELLQCLADMNITFAALQDTDIGRHINRFRKHPSNEVRKLAKLLIRKLKETVDEWVRLNPQSTTDLIADGDSPQTNFQPNNQANGYKQGSDFTYSPNPQNGGSSSEKNYSEPESKPKLVPPRQAPPRLQHSAPKSASAPPPSRTKEPNIDLDKLNSTRRRLHENYQEAENAKKQRTIQVMDIHEIPKPKNAFFPKNKGSFQGSHRR